MTIRVAVDCMGGDHGPHVTVPAALEFLAAHDDAAMILVGRQDAIEQALAGTHAAAGSRVRIVHAPEVVAMDEPPASALRGKRESSMRLAIDLVKAGALRP
jgi:phosphate acyltransferase